MPIETLSRPHTASMRRANTSGRDVLHIQAALARRKFDVANATALHNASHKMLSWHVDERERLDREQQEYERLVAEQAERYTRQAAGEVVEEDRGPQVVRPEALHSLPLNRFHLDARGLPRAPLHPTAFVAAPIAFTPDKAILESWLPSDDKEHGVAPNESWPPPSALYGGLERPQSAPLRQRSGTQSWYPLTLSRPSSPSMATLAPTPEVAPTRPVSSRSSARSPPKSAPRGMAPSQRPPTPTQKPAPATQERPTSSQQHTQRRFHV